MAQVKRVIVYGVANSTSDHRDYAILGEWVFDLYERPIFPAVRVELVQRRSKRTGRFLKGKRKREATVRTQYRDPTTGRFVRAPLTGPKASSKISDDDSIVADVLRIVEDETKHRLFRTPSQREAGEDRVSIGIQHDVDPTRTYTYPEFIRELRRRVHAEWSNR